MFRGLTFLGHTVVLWSSVKIGPARSGKTRARVFWPTVLSVVPLVQCLVCLSSVCLSVCDVLYCGETVRPSYIVLMGTLKVNGHMPTL